MASEFDVLSEEYGITTLNFYLQDKSYITGYAPSYFDAKIFDKIPKEFNIELYPHVHRWQKNIKHFYSDIRNSVKGNIKITAPKSSMSRSSTKTKDKSKKRNTKIDSSTKYSECNANSKVVSAKELKNSLEEKESDDRTTRPIAFNAYSVVLEVRPKDEDVNMGELEGLVRGVNLDGLKWGNSQLTSISYGTSKLSIICTFENNNFSIPDVLQTLMKFENYVKSVDIAAFNKF